MPKIRVKNIDVFTTKPFSGNPAGVIPEADGLDTADMKRIAAELNLAECCYIQRPDSAESAFKVRFFTQSVELDLSSHALIAACFVAIEEGRVALQSGVTETHCDTRMGSVPLDIYFDANAGGTGSAPSKDEVPVSCSNGQTGLLRRIMIHQRRDKIKSTNIPIPELAGILGIDEHEIRGTGLPLEILTHGMKQLVIPIMHQDTMLSMRPDLIKLNLLNKRYDIQTNDLFTLEALNADAALYSRTFSPAIGLWEDVGSGSGAGSIAAYLARHGALHPGSIIVEQGSDRDNLARIFVEVGENDGSVIPLRIGGLAVTSIEQNIVLEGETVTVE
jgi:trans-2,3-dihydro-3-hydroxyanthranilate isomerase